MRQVCARGPWCACALLAVLALVAADRDKRAETELFSPMPFMMATRYGRSSAIRHMSPRNDRFFMISRYGKRSGGMRGTGGAAVLEGGTEGGGLLCQYTGVFSLYRCRHKLNTYDKRSAEEVGEELD